MTDSLFSHFVVQPCFPLRLCPLSFSPPFAQSGPGSSIASKPSIAQFSIRTEASNDRDLLERYNQRSAVPQQGRKPSGDQRDGRGQADEQGVSKSSPRDWRFWMVFISILLSTFIAALDLVSANLGRGRSPRGEWRKGQADKSVLLPSFASFLLPQTAISTAAPVIVNELNGVEFTWM